MIDKELLHDAIREYLKESLEVTVWTEKTYGEYGSNDGVRVTVNLSMDGEELASSSDYTSF